MNLEAHEKDANTDWLIVLLANTNPSIGRTALMMKDLLERF